jgi:hypothetical protein
MAEEQRKVWGMYDHPDQYDIPTARGGVGSWQYDPPPIPDTRIDDEDDEVDWDEVYTTDEYIEWVERFDERNEANG